MKIALIGASGTIGSRILDEAVARGHQVTAISRNPDRVRDLDGVSSVGCDLFDGDSLREVVAGHDALVSSFGVQWDDPKNFELFVPAAEAVIEAARAAGVARVVNVGGVGSLETELGGQVADSEMIPDVARPGSSAQRDQLPVFQAVDDLEWTYFSPPFEIEPGERTGSFRLGDDKVVFADDGRSRISCEDYAVALIDGFETPRHVRARFTIGY